MEITVARESEIPPGERKFYEINGKEIAVINHEGEFYAVRNFCPHMGGPLGRGPVVCTDKAPSGKAVECPFHNWTFDLETGQSTFSERRHIKTYDVQVIYDVEIVDGDIVLHA